MKKQYTQRITSLLTLFALPLPGTVALAQAATTQAGAAQAAAAQTAASQTPAEPQPQLQGLQRPPAMQMAVPLTIPHSSNPFHAYLPTSVPPANLANSARLDSLVHNGVLEISLQDAIALALENNLDLAIARYNIPIAEADILRTKAGGITRGVNAGVVQNTPGGGGVGAFGTSSPGAGAGGTTGGAGGAGTGASGLVQSTLGTGTTVNSYDPIITGQVGLQHATDPQSNLSVYGTPTLRSNSWSGNIGYEQAFATGTSVQFTFSGSRGTSNSPYTFLNPQLGAQYQVQVEQPLLAGFGLAPNLRYLRIARNNKVISDDAFELQVISTVTQTANLYWDLVAAFEDEQVKERSLGFANDTLTSARQQLQLQAIPALDVTKDEGEVARAEGDLTIAKSTLQFQELLMKNALTKNLDDPILESMPVRPTDLSSVNSGTVPEVAEDPQDAINGALARRVDLKISMTNLKNRDISRKAVNNNLLPTLNLVANYGGLGLAGVSNPAANVTSTVPGDFGGSVSDAFNNSAPNYFVGLNLAIPLRNRQAKSDQYRSELEARQAEILLQQQRKQIRIEVRNAQYSLEQAAARVTAAAKARDIAARTFEVMGKEQQLGAGSAFDTLTARQTLATEESLLVAARTAYQKARVELQRAIGTTLTENHVSIESARSGVQPANNVHTRP